MSSASKEIFEHESLIGVSVTGWMNNPEVLFDPEVMRKGAEIVKQINKEVAAIIGINPAARCTAASLAVMQVYYSVQLLVFMVSTLSIIFVTYR